MHIPHMRPTSDCPKVLARLVLFSVFLIGFMAVRLHLQGGPAPVW